MEKEMLYREILEVLPLPTLRVIARKLGANKATQMHKEDLIILIIDLIEERVVVGPRSNRGAPAKDTYVDPAILERLAAVHRAKPEKEKPIVLEVHSPEKEEKKEDVGYDRMHYGVGDDKLFKRVSWETYLEPRDIAFRPEDDSHKILFSYDENDGTETTSEKERAASEASSKPTGSAQEPAETERELPSEPAPDPAAESEEELPQEPDSESVKTEKQAPMSEMTPQRKHKTFPTYVSGSSSGATSKRASAPAPASADAPAPPEGAGEDGVYSGILEITAGGYGFLRAKNCQPSVSGDVFLAAPLIHALKLREGDFITCSAKPRFRSNSPALETLYTVNGMEPGKYENRFQFENLTARYPSNRYPLSRNSEDVALRLLDLFIPIGRGQRGLIIAPPKAGKTTLLKTIAGALTENSPKTHLIILLIDERPEEVTDFRMSFPNAEVIYSTFDETAEHHVRAASLTLAHAKRLVEMGKDVFILLDSITKLTRAYNNLVNTGKTLTGGLDAGAFAEPKRFFGAARNTLEAGSLTILATALVDDGSRMDDVIYEEFKGTGNADIFLSRELAERRIFPSIDVRKSGTRREELLLTNEERMTLYDLRDLGLAESGPALYDMLRKARTVGDFVSRVPEWLRVYKPPKNNPTS